ncbi:MAG TPA: DUF4430 domain-containing protein [Solirubrobacteraceae bacterium]|jgi:hypothetical protein
MQSKRSLGIKAPLALVIAGMALAIAPMQALANTTASVSVEGRSSTLLSPTTVEVGNGSSEAKGFKGESMPYSCPNNTAYEAIEEAVKGDWDRSIFVETLMGETLTWEPREEYWIFYYNNNYAEYGVCAQALKNGDTVLMQAGVSGPEADEWVPESVPLELERVTPASGPIEEGSQLTVHVSEWRPTTTIGAEDPVGSEHWVIPPSERLDAEGYTVEAGSEEVVTDSAGDATLTMNEAGTIEVQASMPGSTTNWSRTPPLNVCVKDATHPC